MVAVDAVEELRSLIQTGWTASNTDSKTPAFIKVWDKNRSSLNFATPDKDLITFYETTGPYEPSGIGSARFRHTSFLKIDIRSANTEAHALLVKEEVLRILDTNKSAPGGSFDKIIPPFGVENKSDKARGIFRYIIDLKLMTHRRDLTP